MMTLEQWTNDSPITKDELDVLFPTKPFCSPNRDYTIDKFFRYLDSKQYGLQNTHQIDLNRIGATQLIDKLFDYYVDNDTLVITTELEHNAVKANIKKCANVLTINTDEFNSIIHGDFHIINAILDNAKQFNKCFVYIIGMQNAYMIATPNEFFIKLKNALVQNDIDHILCIDAVQEFFLTPRDYRIFDYVIGTAHATISNHNLGFLVRKKQVKSFNDNALIDDLHLFLLQLDILFKRKRKIYNFKQLISDYFKKTFSGKYVQLNSVDYAFSCKIDCNLTFDEYQYLESIIARKYDISLSPFPGYIIVRLRSPSIVLGVNFNNDHRTNDHYSLEEGIHKVFVMVEMLMDR